VRRYLKKLKSIFRSRYIFKIICFLGIVYAILTILFFEGTSQYHIEDNEIVGVVTKYKIDGDKLTLYLKEKETVVVNYYLSSLEEKEFYLNTLKLGDKISANGVLKEPSSNTVPNLFNYQKYLLYRNIFFLMDAERLNYLEHNTSLLYAIKNWMIDKIDKVDHTGYFRIFLLGDKSLMENDIITAYQKNGISHLFSISGMHVSFIASIILAFLSKITYQIKFQYSVVSGVLLFYLFLTDLGASILRTVIMFLLTSINRCYHLEISKVDIMLLTLVVAIIINPFILCDVGFQFSYGISLALVLFQTKTIQIKKKLLQSLFISFLCFLVSFPICVYHFYEVNFLSIILNVIMIPIVSMIVFPFTMITFLLPFLYPIYEVMITLLERINSWVVAIDIFQIVFTKPNLVVIICYYLIIGLTLWNWKFVFMLFIMMFFHKLYPYFDSKFLFIMLDVGQGDCLFIELPYNQGNILIDTGGKIEYEKEDWQQREEKFSYATRVVIPYLNSLGLKKIDYLILTHGDFDHMGEAINLVENIKVEKVMFNCGEFNELEQELIEVLDKKKIPYYSCIKELNIDDNKLYFLNNKEHDNENDNSSVIYTELSNHKFLFMGDAGVEVEEDLIKKYNLQDIDVLKVGHHGSKTSSGKEFINEINPKYSIISVGKNNRYGHPNKEVLNVLEDSKMYRTDEAGSIMFKIKNNKLQIETCTP